MEIDPRYVDVAVQRRQRFTGRTAVRAGEDRVFGDSVALKRTWMMAVSCTKAMLVILFFMHLKWEANWKWVLTVPASMMSAFLVLMLVPDVGLRMRHASEQRLLFAAELPPKPGDYRKFEEEQPSLRVVPAEQH